MDNLKKLKTLEKLEIQKEYNLPTAEQYRILKILLIINISIEEKPKLLLNK